MNDTSVDVEEFPSPQPEIEGVSILCPGESGELFVDGDYSSIMWSNGFTSSSISISNADTYSVSVIAQYKLHDHVSFNYSISRSLNAIVFL